MTPSPESTLIRIGLPKGRMQDGVLAILSEAGIHVHFDSRGYRPRLTLPGFDAKMLKPQNIVEMLSAGSRDLGFAGADWVAELQADVVELLDGRRWRVLQTVPIGLKPVYLVTEVPRCQCRRCEVIFEIAPPLPGRRCITRASSRSSSRGGAG